MMSRYEQFSAAISAIYHHIQQIEREEMERLGGKGTFAQYLAALYRHPDGITAARLAQNCGKDKADVSRMITILEEKGLVCKEGASYRALLKLTETGNDAAEHVQKRAATAVELGGDGITEENRETFYAVLELIAKNLRAVSENGLPEKKEN